MPALRTLPPLFVVLALILPVAAQADELKDISQLAQQGQAPQALTKLNAYIAKNPKSVDALFLRGVILTDTGKRDEAMKAFTEMTEKYPALPEPYNNLAVLYAERGEYDKARHALESAIKTHPSYATAHENLGDIYARMASQAYDKALQLDNGNTRPQSKLALIKSLTTSAPPTQLASQSSSATSVALAPAPLVNLGNGQVRALEQTKPVVKYETPAKSDNTSRPASVVTEIKTPDAKPAAPKSEMPVETPPQPTPVPPKTAEISKPAAEPAKLQDQAKSGSNLDEQAIEQAVRQWAKAWSDKNVAGYLASYGAGFKTPDGQSRQDWEKTRRQRISAPASISVEVSNLRLKQDGDLVRASFKQSYRAGGTAMRTSKTLVLKKGGNRWLIEQELTER
ncbi:nuclear transport factor 2 family protein [Methylovorus mays]|uniref:nuclear transport factor 2 family protein n=1 Tax=Methylovorus mays TaxID=184077 RepID=UPI001E2F4FB4|nr:nuclear transport factor 2 family protein [Methylovorus mays]MCB5207771.1 tetratricopeptide repeat protein [Methylovorus mays]